MALAHDRWHPPSRERYARHSPDSAASDSDRPRSRTTCHHSHRHSPSPARDRFDARRRGSSAGHSHAHSGGAAPAPLPPHPSSAAAAAATPPNDAMRHAEWLGPGYLLSPTQDVRLMRSHAPMAAIAHAAPHAHGAGGGAGITFGPPMAAAHPNGVPLAIRRSGPPTNVRTLNSAVDAQTSPHVRKLFEAGAEAIAADDHAAALPVFSAILKVPHLTTQNEYDACNRRAWCFERLGKLEEALQDLTAAIDVKVNAGKPEDATASFMARGRVALKLGRNPKSALNDFTECLKFNTNYYLAYQQRATAYHTLGRLTEELADLTEMARLRPNEWRSLYQRGNCLMDLRKCEQAIEDYSAVLRLNHHHKRARFLRAMAYHKLKRFDRALTEYSASIEKMPESADAYYNRGLVREKLADTQPGGIANALSSAVSDFRKAKELYADRKDIEDCAARIAAVDQRLRGGGAADANANAKSDAEPKAKSQTEPSPSPAPADREAAQRKRKAADASPNAAVNGNGSGNANSSGDGSGSAKKAKGDACGDVKAPSPLLLAAAPPTDGAAQSPRRPVAAAAAAAACTSAPADVNARLTAVEAELRRVAAELTALAAAHTALQRLLPAPGPAPPTAGTSVPVKPEATSPAGVG